jgi:hypothetical protein
VTADRYGGIMNVSRCHPYRIIFESSTIITQINFFFKLDSSLPRYSPSGRRSFDLRQPDPRGLVRLRHGLRRDRKAHTQAQAGDGLNNETDFSF